jgi:hypothetical protein
MGLNELKDMGGVIGETLLVQLASIEAVDKEPHSPFQGLDATGKATRAPSQTSQIVTQFGIISFYRECVGLSLRDFILTVVIPQTVIGIEGIAMVAFGFHSFIHHILDHRLGTFPDDFIAQKTACCPIYDGDDVDWLFFSPMKVKSSSISATLTSSGTGALGNRAAFALTHNETVRW